MIASSSRIRPTGFSRSSTIVTSIGGVSFARITPNEDSDFANGRAQALYSAYQARLRALKGRGAEKAISILVSDVEMPRVDGFQLTSRIRTEMGLLDLPVIIVTSLASETHRRRGLEVGAQAYIVKSQFNQSNLLETVQQLLGN